MIILTAANVTKGTDEQRRNKNFSFKEIVRQNLAKAEKFGYKMVVYDLGNLGIGEPFHIEDRVFKEKGYYGELKGGYRSKSLFKPEIVKRCLEKNEKFTVYLDGDALLNDRIDEIKSEDFDVGVTLRRLSELETEWHQKNMEVVKYINAGVIFFNPTRTTLNFIEKWKNRTEELNNDQMALNDLVCPEFRPEVNSIHVIGGVRIKYFSGDKYNYYYFNESLSPNIKIYHFKGSVREFYPFNWRRKIYCLGMGSIKSMYRAVFKNRKS